MSTIFYNFLLLFFLIYVIIYKLNNIYFWFLFFYIITAPKTALRKDERWTITKKFATR
jgi:hypothetical protein